MSDEQIVEYLRSRAAARPPMDLVGSIADAVEAVPQRRHSWFAPFIPAVAAVGAAGVVLIAVLLVGQGPQIGPPPSGSSPTQVESAVPTADPTPSPTPTPRLLGSGESQTIDAMAGDGRWGTVTVTRGDDVGGYGDGSVSAEGFVVEIHVAYDAESEPNPREFGRPDWSLRPVGETLEPGGRRERTRPTLATYPGAIDIFTNPLEGWLLFEVPRDTAGEPLELVYQPSGFSEPVATFVVREPGPPPDPVAEASPGPPAPVTYVEKQGYPFTVIDHAEADALFDDPDTCTNPEAGYTVTYPDAWFSNTEIGDWPACSWFSPTFYDVGEDPNEVPPQVAIVLVFEDGSSGFTCDPDTTVDEPVTVAGFDADRMELLGCTAENGEYTPQPPEYSYTVIVAEQPAETPTLRATTSFEGAADYELNRAVLDRIMALIEFGE